MGMMREFRKYLVDKEVSEKLACPLKLEWAQYRALVIVLDHKLTKIVTVSRKPGSPTAGQKRVTSYHLQRSAIVFVLGNFA